MHPVPKCSSPKSVEYDLRPITLTSQLAKVLEGFTLVSLYRQAVDSLDPKQFSACGRSTTHTLVYFLHTILEASDSGGNYLCIFFADFSKGFDLVDHNVIMQELELLGVNNHITRWIGEFLRSTPQFVKIGDAVSSPVLPHGGIPQGTRLAPLLFAILVNRLVRDWPHRVKYVDDTTIHEVIPRCSPSYLPIIANGIYSYASQRGMRLNPTKCRELVVNFLQYQPSSLSPLQLSGTTTQRVSTYKILGVHISEDPTWNMHIDYVFKEANKRLYAIRLLKKSGVTTDDLVEIYCSLIRSVLEYAAPVWSDLPDYLASVVESIQKKALKIILPMTTLRPRMSLVFSVCLPVGSRPA